MMSASPLTRIVPWSQQLLAEILDPGETAIDLTAGKGKDTLFLYRTVGAGGRIIAFDVQPRALELSAERLGAAAPERVWFLTGNETGAFGTLVDEWLRALGEPHSARHLEDDRLRGG